MCGAVQQQRRTQRERAREREGDSVVWRGGQPLNEWLILINDEKIIQPTKGGFTRGGFRLYPNNSNTPSQLLVGVLTQASWSVLEVTTAGKATSLSESTNGVSFASSGTGGIITGDWPWRMLTPGPLGDIP